MGNGVQPGAEASRLAVPRERCQHLRKHLLGGIFRPLRTPQLAVAVAVDGSEVAAIDGGERLLIGTRQGDEGNVLDRGGSWTFPSSPWRVPIKRRSPPSIAATSLPSTATATASWGVRSGRKMPPNKCLRRCWHRS